jgi:hypothetical protein
MAKGRSIRFGVGRDPSARSSAWTLSSAKKTDDVYVAQRSHDGEFKISLHESGVFRAAFEADYAKREGSVVPPGEDRLTRRWDRPQPLYAGGPTRACSIIVPWFSLHGLREKGGPEGISWFTAPDEGEAVNFDIFLRPDGVRPWAGARLVGYEQTVGELALPSGAGVGVYARTRQMSGDELDNIETFLRNARKREWEHRPGMDAQTSALIHGPRDDGSVWFMDVLIEKSEDATGLWEADDRAFTGQGHWRDIVEDPPPS